MEAKNTCETCMFVKECSGKLIRRTCKSYRLEPFKLAKGEAKWTFKRKATK
ncbi:hypothetical protein M0R72_21795 [Candidatus Pacearchaeota archaeon]|jgi:uncharacterized metal-binding protein|nr:hypothetical protein [Candidatus Pacearchaeota archaeon]